MVLSLPRRFRAGSSLGRVRRPLLGLSTSTLMRAVLQRVSSARVVVDARETGRIATGMLALVGVENGDGPEDVAYIANKIRDLRIFEDESGKMNRSLVDVGGQALVVSQFTLAGDCRNGRRPCSSPQLLQRRRRCSTKP